MSTRYVWEKYSLAYDVIKSAEKSTSALRFATSGQDPNYGVLASECSAGDAVGYFYLKGSLTNIRGAGTWAASRYPYISTANKWADEKGYKPAYAAPDLDGEWEAPEWAFSDWNGTIYFKAADGTYPKIPELEMKAKPGEFTGNVSAPLESQYPDGSAYGNSWYQYKGADNIDPASVTYPSSELEPGQSITVSVTPSRSNVYGGTITYHYQYRLNGGNWVDWLSTTGTSASYTVPEGASNLEFRVRASDNMGFTSADYVTGPTVAVSQLKAYVGVAEKARKVERIYVGVNGKARQVVKGYIGVNGKARKFL